MVERIIDLMNKKGTTARALADYLGVPPSTITDWKNRKTESYKNYILQLSDFFEVSSDYILGKTDNPKPIPEILKGTPWAFDDGRFNGLTDEDIEVLADMAQVLKNKREKEGN